MVDFGRMFKIRQLVKVETRITLKHYNDYHSGRLEV